jgi:hypothetical protein
VAGSGAAYASTELAETTALVQTDDDQAALDAEAAEAAAAEKAAAEKAAAEKAAAEKAAAEKAAAEKAAAEKAAAEKAAAEKAAADQAAEDQEAADAERLALQSLSTSTSSLTATTEIGNGTACSELGYTKIDRESGDVTLPFGRLVWDGRVLTYTAAPGYVVDLCIKGGSAEPLVQLFDTGSTRYEHPQGISHIGYKDPVRTSTAVTPSVVPSTECGVPSYFLVPSTAGVVYLVDGVVRDAGFRVNGPGTKVVTARAAEGYQLTNPTFSVSLVLAPAKVCATAVTPVVVPSTECDVPSYFLVPSTAGVVYLVDGVVRDAGFRVNGPGTKVVTARAAEGYQLTNPTFSVSLVLAPAKVCATAVTPVVVPSTECDVPSYFLVPSTAGVVYLVDGVVRDAGFRVNGPGTKVSRPARLRATS